MYTNSEHMVARQLCTLIMCALLTTMQIFVKVDISYLLYFILSIKRNIYILDQEYECFHLFLTVAFNLNAYGTSDFVR